MKTLQKFTPEYLDQCRQMSTQEIVEFIEAFRQLHGEAAAGPAPRDRSRLISLKVPESLLSAFRTRARLQGVPYQTQIKKLMKDWLV